ncbi:MAG: aminotransferase class I/II-fold pyridoxal phosphate-dependent enzyme, partial [Nitrospirae bacterium]|nr:aminotransferase class I/II-fold pyridoxal phosphate-dependent enzyme [Fimbriimonadaceae bacterium]
MAPALASRTGLLKPSPTLAITAKAKALKASGRDIIALAAGEPDFNTPEAVCQAAEDAIRKGFTKYTPTVGIPELRQAVCDKALRENGLRAEPSQVVISCGAKQSLFNALMVVIEPGDEVLVPAPFWATYEDQVAVAGGTVRRIATTSDSGFLPSIEQFKEALGPKTRAIVLNSPNNPTGAVYPRSLFKEIAALAIRHDLWIIADDIYERLVYNEPHQSIAALGSE